MEEVYNNRFNLRMLLSQFLLCSIRSRKNMRQLTHSRLNVCSMDAPRGGEMRKRNIPLIGFLFCEKCDSINSYRTISKILQIGERVINTKYGSQTLHRYEKIQECIKCRNVKIKIVYE